MAFMGEGDGSDWINQDIHDLQRGWRNAGPRRLDVEYLPPDVRDRDGNR